MLDVALPNFSKLIVTGVINMCVILYYFALRFYFATIVLLCYYCIMWIETTNQKYFN